MAGQGGSRNRRDEETLAVLAGETRDKDKAAVRRFEIKKIVADAVMEAANAVSRTADKISRIASFRYGNPPPEAGFHSWRAEDTRWIPPGGIGGGAVWVPRNSAGAGTWLAMTAGGGEGQNTPRAFLSTTSSNPQDWGLWREVYHQGSVLGGVSFGENGEPDGALFQTIGDATGYATLFASGLMIQVEDLEPLVFSTPDVVNRTWSFRRPFIAPPRVFSMIPAVNGGSHVDVDPVGIGHAFVNVLNETQARVGLRRSWGAPNFIASSSVSGMSAMAIGAWGVP